MILPIILIIVSLALLFLGAETLVRGSASIARKFGIQPLVIGLTVVAFGTSAPELIVNVVAALRGSADIGIGNVVGSNIVNILLILGLAAAISPITVKRSTVWKEIPFALLAVVLVYIMGNDQAIDGLPYNLLSRTDGILLISMFIIFLYYTFGIARINDGEESKEIKVYSVLVSSTLVIVGLVLLFIGGRVLVDNAVDLARTAGLSESLIGLTIVAIGTSFPELATSIVAALHKHDEIAVGNIVGSNIFNIFWVLGLTSTILQLPFNFRVNIDIGVAIAATFLLFLVMFIGERHKLNRGQGILFVLLYFLYLGYLIRLG